MPPVRPGRVLQKIEAVKAGRALFLWLSQLKDCDETKAFEECKVDCSVSDYEWANQAACGRQLRLRLERRNMCGLQKGDESSARPITPEVILRDLMSAGCSSKNEN